MAQGYRFDHLTAPQAAVDPDELFVILALSGGGTRAAALSYGVMSQLRAVRLPTGRTLLDEVDVISSVSGGSFTAAYYGLFRDHIFDPASNFHRDFLYYPVQRDLVGQAVYWPANWRRLRSRVEIAANLYSHRVFGDSTFAALQAQPRPFVILNATDASTGARFEFTQDQFDLLCADLTPFRIARAVAASSAFPGLLNSMTIDSYNAHGGCGYNGTGTQTSDWVALALKDGYTNYTRYNAARQLLAYRDPARKHLHLLDGGLADNIGLRSVLQSLQSTDRPEATDASGAKQFGGWSLLQKINVGKVKTIVVVTVNARTNRKNDWDLNAAGPGSFAVIGASSGVPMSSFSTETLELLRGYGLEAELDDPDSPRFYGVEIAFENLALADERDFFSNLGTNFDLARTEVDCLIDRGAQLLRESSSVTEKQTQTFASFVAGHLNGTMHVPPPRRTGGCTSPSTRREIKRHHYIDVGVQYSAGFPAADGADDTHGVGVAFRVTKPSGFGATVGYGTESLAVPESRHPANALGKMTLRTVSGGLLFTHRFGGLEATAALSAGYGFGGFSLDDGARDRYAAAGVFGLHPEASDSWVVKPGISLWQNLTSRFAATVSGSYVIARPTISLGGAAGETNRKVTADAFRLAAGIAVKVF